MKYDENYVGIIRGVVIVGNHHAGAIGLAEGENPENLNVTMLATPWHRHDNCDNLELEFRAIESAAKTFKDGYCMELFYQYKDYKA